MNSVPPNNQGKQPGFTLEAADNALSAPKSEDLSATPSCPEQTDGPEGTPIEQRATSVRSDVQRTETASSSQTDKSAPTSEKHDSWFAWAKSYVFSLLWGTESNEQSTQNITTERFEPLVDGNSEVDDNSEVDEELEQLTDTEIAEMVRDSVMGFKNSAIQCFPEPWHKVFEHYLTDHDNIAPEFLPDQTCQELIEYYRTNKKSNPYGAINQDKEKLNIDLKPIFNLQHSVPGLPLSKNLSKLNDKIEEINKLVDDAMHLQDKFESFSNSQQEVSPSSAKSKEFSKTVLVPVHKLKPDENHIESQFTTDIVRNMDVTAYSPDGEVEFHIKTKSESYMVLDTKQTTSRPGRLHQMHESTINGGNEVEVPDIKLLSISKENTSVADCSKKTIKLDDSASEATTLTSKQGDIRKLEETFFCQAFRDTDYDEFDSTKKYGKRSEIRAAGKQAVTRFAKQSASMVKQWFPSDASTAEMESYAAERHSNSLTTFMSDLASQTCGNTMHMFLSHIIQYDNYTLVPIDMEYRTEFYAQKDGSVIAKLHAVFPFIELRHMKSPLPAIKINQSVTIDTEVNLTPEKLDTRRFECCIARFGDLKSIEIGPKPPKSFG